MSRSLALLVAVTLPLFATACSGGGGGEKSAKPPAAGAAPIAQAPQAVPGWEIIRPTGLRGYFSLPSPTANNAQEGVQTFVGGQGSKLEIYVTVYSRGGAQIGEDDGDALAVFEKQRLDQQNTRLMEKGFKPEIKYEKELGEGDMLGQQIRTNLGEQFIFNQFYVTKEAFYHVKIDNADDSNSYVQQFMKSFHP